MISGSCSTSRREASSQRYASTRDPRLPPESPRARGSALGHRQAGERIWTESSYKYEPIQITRLLERCGFRVRSQWVDNDARFALTLTAGD